jgi:hypothetical protein
LKFKFSKYVKTLEIDQLISLKTKPTKESIYNNQSVDTELFLTDTIKSLSNISIRKSKNKEKTLYKNKKLNLEITQTQSDSDDNVEDDSDDEDDLIPYNTSNDVLLSSIKQPKYLRDILDGNVIIE